jgi:hypothetical protein
MYRRICVFYIDIQGFYLNIISVFMLFSRLAYRISEQALRQEEAPCPGTQ